MSWRIHLANQAIRRLQILPGKPPVLAAWTHRNRVHFYQLTNGTLLAEKTIPPAPVAPRSSEAWQQFVGELTGPNPQYALPYVRTRTTEIFATDDGKLRVYKLADDTLTMETDGAEEPIELVGAERFLAMDMDRALGTVAGLDETGKLHIYRQNIRVGSFDVGLQAEMDVRLAVQLSRGGSNIYVTDGRQLVSLDANGKVLKTLATHYFVGQMACSPGGGMLVTSDLDAGVLRAYRGETLTLTHQRFGIDLIAHAQQIQLLADLPPMGTAVSALAAYSRGILAFAMSGVVCVSHVEQMDEVPRPKTLL